ncbi:MAG: nuclear transport factor 2 family protein [Burkholderiaceae bacterium]|nr:nuclear transport factor 2 family protein [Burkholderiaceae bacterium]
MDELIQLAHERACERLIHSFARALDQYDYAAALRLWADDGVFVALGREHKGHSGLLDWMNQREKDMVCRHIVTNIVVDVQSETHASASAYCSAWRVRGWRGREPGPMSLPAYVVEYTDAFVRDPAKGWLLSRRDVAVALAGVEQRQALRSG